MWYQVRDMRQKGLNKSQISRELSIDRATVRKYLKMDETSFEKWMKQVKRMPRKLRKYYGYVQSLLEDQPYLSAAQVEDRLKETYTDLPEVHSKTVYNFVQSIREKHGIKKPKADSHRDFEQIPELDYGKQAQVDFGEYWMRTQGGSRQKVYFLAMVLSRSRYKYVLFWDHPFTSSDSIIAHQAAFTYYQGVPVQALYDQDKVFVVDENLGDVVLTAAFQRYVQQENFQAIFCRKADPQTKGKVENVVKYVKNNFLRGRIFTTIEKLNEQGIQWLERTANAKVHGTTRKIPQQEWEIEKAYLLPIKLNQMVEQESQKVKSYQVRKDNTIAYRVNFYTVPTGTYVNRESRVWLQVEDNILTIQDAQGRETIACHPISQLKGKTIRNNDHLRDKKSSLEDKEKEVLAKLEDDPKCTKYLEQLHQDKPRYYHDHLRVLLKLLTKVSPEQLQVAIHKCLELGIYNANEVTQIALHDQRQNIALSKLRPSCTEGSASLPVLHTIHVPEQTDLKPQTSDINTYQSIM